MDVVSAVARSRMSGRQYLVVLGCMLCNMVDGYDLSIIGFALPHLPDGFASSVEKGWLISVGLVGMAVGAILIAPMADRLGRRRFILVGVTLNLAAIAATALAPTVQIMFVTRFCTGVAVGILSSLSIVLAQEYAPLAKRNLVAALVTIGFSLGTVLGGAIGLSLVTALGGAWQVFFWSGAVLTAVALVAVVLVVPESLSFLMTQQTPQARDRIVRIAASMGLRGVDPGAALPRGEQPARGRGGLLDRRYRSRSILLWIGYAVLNAAYYFVTSWTPQLVTTSTGSAETGTTVGTVISVGAVAGSVAFGLLGMRVLATKLGWIFLALAMLAQIVFALTLSGGVAVAAAAVLGLAAFASLTSYVSAAPQLYPVHLRSRGLGYVYGISRAGSIVAPIVAGYLITVTTARTMYLVASLLFAVSGICAAVLWVTTRGALVAERRALTENADAATV